MKFEELNQLAYIAKLEYEQNGTIPANKEIYDYLVKLGMKFDKPFEEEKPPYKNSECIQKEFSSKQTEEIEKYSSICRNELKTQYDEMTFKKNQGEFKTTFSNDEYRKMRNLLEQFDITKQRINMIMSFHEYLRMNIDRREFDNNKPNPNYYSCTKSIAQLVEEGYNDRLIYQATELLCKIGYLHKVTIKKVGCRYYPLFRQSTI